MNKAILDWVWRGSSVTYSSEYQAVLDRATALGYSHPSSAQKTKQDTFLQALKTAGIFSELDLLYVTANDVTGNFWKLNWITPASYEITEPAGALTKTSNSGVASNGSSTYGLTSFVLNTHGVKYLQDNASISYAIANNVAENKNICGVAGATTGDTRIAVRWGDGNYYGNINSTSALYNTYANATSIGFYQSIRRNSATIQLYKNGAKVDEETKVTNARPDTNPLWICGSNTSPATHGTHILQVFAIGSNLEAKASDFYTAWNTYITSL